MGSVESSQPPSSGHADLRTSTLPIRLPMPDQTELERRFTKVLVSPFSDLALFSVNGIL